jgi:hypothetical protein
LGDDTQHAVNISQDIGIGKTDHAIPLRFQKLCSMGVIAIFGGMCIPIDFDDEARRF